MEEWEEDDPVEKGESVLCGKMEGDDNERSPNQGSTGLASQLGSRAYYYYRTDGGSTSTAGKRQKNATAQWRVGWAGVWVVGLFGSKEK